MLFRSWGFPGKSTGVGCHCLLHFRQATQLQFLGRELRSCFMPPFSATSLRSGPLWTQTPEIRSLGANPNLVGNPLGTVALMAMAVSPWVGEGHRSGCLVKGLFLAPSLQKISPFHSTTAHMLPATTAAHQEVLGNYKICYRP